MAEMTDAQVALMAAAHSLGEGTSSSTTVTNRADALLRWLRTNS